MKKDSVMKYNKDNIGSRKAAYDAIPKTKFDFFLIKNYETTSTLFAQKYMKYIAYQQTAPVYDWKIMDSVKTIKGFTCRKAMLTLRGNTYEAWFTDEISVFDGLYFFQGLPGLILEVTCIERKYKFTFVGIEENDSPINYRNTSLHAVTDKRKKFLLLADDWEKNTFRNIFKTGDMKLADSTADSEAFIEQMQAQINEKKPKFKLEIF
jgi:GLPGLI family protein